MFAGRGDDRPSALWIVTLTAAEFGASLTDIRAGGAKFHAIRREAAVRCSRAGYSKRSIAAAMRCTPSSVGRYLNDEERQ